MTLVLLENSNNSRKCGNSRAFFLNYIFYTQKNSSLSGSTIVAFVRGCIRQLYHDEDGKF